MGVGGEWKDRSSGQRCIPERDVFAAHKAGGYDGGRPGRAGSFRWGAHGELVQGNLPISPHAMVNRSQPHKHLQGSLSGQGTQ